MGACGGGEVKECLNVGEKVRELTPEGCRLLEINSLACVPGGADNGLLGLVVKVCCSQGPQGEGGVSQRQASN